MVCFGLVSADILVLVASLWVPLSPGCVYWILEFPIFCVLCILCFFSVSVFNICSCLILITGEWERWRAVGGVRHLLKTLLSSSQITMSGQVCSEKVQFICSCIFSKVMDFILFLRADICMEKFDSVQGCCKFTANWYFAGKNHRLVKVVEAICSILWWSDISSSHTSIFLTCVLSLCSCGT